MGTEFELCEVVVFSKVFFTPTIKKINALKKCV